MWSFTLDMDVLFRLSRASPGEGGGNEVTICGNSPRFMEVFVSIDAAAMWPKAIGAPMKVNNSQIVALDQFLDFIFAPIPACLGPFDDNSISHFNHILGGRSKVCPQEFEFSPVPFNSLGPPRFVLIDILPWGSSGARNSTPEDRASFLTKFASNAEFLKEF